MEMGNGCVNQGRERSKSVELYRTCKAFVRPARLLAVRTLGRLWQVAFAPVVLMFDVAQFLARNVGCILLTVGDGKILTLDMCKVFTYCSGKNGSC